MPRISSPIPEPLPSTTSSASLWIAGMAMLGGVASFALALSPSPWVGLSLGGSAVLGLIVWRILGRERVWFAVVLVGSFVMIDHTPGVDVQEVGYALLLAGYLGAWLVARLWVQRRPLAPHAVDSALVTFFVGVILSVVMTLVHEGEASTYASMAAAVLMLALYFPMREHLETGGRDTYLVLGAVVTIVGLIALRNLLMYRELLVQAVLADFIRNRRVVSNLTVLTGGTVLSFVLATLSAHRRVQLTGIGLMALSVPALIVTQSRGQWVAALFGLAVAFAVGRPSYRKTFTASAAIALLTGIGIAIVVAGDKLQLVATALFTRWSTIATSTTRDISLISRFYETRTVLEEVASNPLLGHGMGVPYAKYDIITQQIWVSTWIHNGYASLLYTFGVWGLGLMLTVLLGSVWRGIRAYRLLPSGSVSGACGLAGAAMCCALMLGSMSENPFHNNDGYLILAISVGLAGGAHAHARRVGSIRQ